MPSFGRGSGHKKCIRCLRSKKEAIEHHLATMQPCDNEDCPFYDDIIEAIEEKRNRPQFTFGKPKKQFTFGKPTKEI